MFPSENVEIREHNLHAESLINQRAVRGDLFDNRTKEQKLEDWCKSKKIFSKADIMRYGLDNFYIRADRSIRELVQRGKVMRIFSSTRMAHYRYIGDINGKK